MTSPELIWQPRTDVRDTAQIGRFLTWLERERGLRFDDYAALHHWSVTDLDGFWSAVWEHFGVRGSFERVLGRREMPGAEWFPGATLNYAEHALGLPEHADEVAVLGYSQTRDRVELTWGQLREQVARARAGLQRLGVGPGDRVVAYLPNIPETLVAFLATASLGAVWASCAPEFGARSVVDRFAQIEPAVLLAIAGYGYGAKDVDRREQVAEIRAGLPTLRHVVHVPYGENTLPDAVSWDDLLAEPATPPGQRSGEGEDTPPDDAGGRAGRVGAGGQRSGEGEGTPPDDAGGRAGRVGAGGQRSGEGEGPALAFEPVPFAHPLCVLFSSGTTGKPKAIVHGHGGILLEHLKNHALSWDLGPGDRILWFSTTAWMMWNALVSALLVRASIVMIDGNPLHPDIRWQWRLAAETGATLMGASPGFLMACRAEGVEPAKEFDLSRLRQVGAAGSPLPPEGYRWVAEQLGADVLLNVGSGGTDVCSGIVQGSPLQPVWAGEISGPCLGVDAKAFDAEGRPVVDELGELVITAPMPSMPVGFWGDTDGARYRGTYFDTWPGVWRHGDWVRFSRVGSAIIAGRSDATLNRGGVRLGTAEFYRVVEELPEVDDSLVVHLEDPAGGNGRLLLFVRLRDGVDLDDALRRRISTALRTELSPRHIPDGITAVPVVPHNRTGKKLELPVKKILLGAAPDEVAGRDVLADPTALDAFVTIRGAL